MSVSLPAPTVLSEPARASDLAPSDLAAPARRRWRVRAAVLAAAALVLLPATAASAHVRVIPDSASADGFAKVTFRIPTESATAGTTKVEIALPTAAPFTSVSYLPVPGWTVQVVNGPLPAPVVVNGATLTQAPLKVVWTAGAGVQIAPGAFQEFSIVAGPMPAAGTSVLLPAIQTYSDGTTVHWDQVAKDGAAEPEFPAPKLVAPVAEESATDVAAPSPGASSSTGPTIAAEATGSGAPSADPVARSLGGLALILAATGLGLVVARRRTPQVKP